MNKAMETLNKELEELDKKKKSLAYEIKSIQDSLEDAIFEETRIINEVLKNNLIDIVTLIHKEGLKCSGVRDAETMWSKTVYKVSDGTYFVNIVANNGTVELDYTHIDNDGGGKTLKEKAMHLLRYSIIPYCEKNKDKYIK